jgi:hypothetical protein
MFINVFSIIITSINFLKIILIALGILSIYEFYMEYSINMHNFIEKKDKVKYGCAPDYIEYKREEV